MAKYIYIIRHGLTDANRKKIYAGRNNESICEEGVIELFKVRNKIKEFNIDLIISSPIQRCIHTAEILNSFLNKNIEIEENFIEMGMGPWEGLTENEVAKRFPKEWKMWNMNPSKLLIKGRETLYEIQTRALEGMRKLLLKKWPRILVVTHVAVIRVLIVHYNNLNLRDYRKIDVPNCSLYVLNFNKQNGIIRRIL